MKRQTGFSLIEVAVSVFILAVGLLGLLSLQLTSFKSMDMALKSNQADTFLQQISEIMRANKTSLDVFIIDKTIVDDTSICGGSCNDAQSELNELMGTMSQRFSGATLKITSVDIDNYVYKQEETINDNGEIDTKDFSRYIKLYTLKLTWLEPASFILHGNPDDKDDEVSHSQSLKVIL